MIKYYVISLAKATDAIFILIKVHLGGSMGPIFTAPYPKKKQKKTVSNDNEPIAVKVDIEIVCTH